VKNIKVQILFRWSPSNKRNFSFFLASASLVDCAMKKTKKIDREWSEGTEEERKSVMQVTEKVKL
jgi:hypothetical protein